MLVAQLCLTLCDPMDCIPPDSSVHGILQGRILEWIAILFSRGSSWSRDQTKISCIVGRFFTIWATREAQYSQLTMVSGEQWRDSAIHIYIYPFFPKLPFHPGSHILCKIVCHIMCKLLPLFHFVFGFAKYMSIEIWFFPTCN